MPRHDPIPPRAPARPRVDYAPAWARYRRIMRWMVLLAVLCVAGVLGFFYWDGDPMPLNMVIATSLGVFLTVIVGTGLMSLAFLSSGSGHDEAVNDPFEDES